MTDEKFQMQYEAFCQSTSLLVYPYSSYLIVIREVN